MKNMRRILEFLFALQIYTFLSSPIACVACEQLELLKTEITLRRRRRRRRRPSKLF